MKHFDLAASTHAFDSGEDTEAGLFSWDPTTNLVYADAVVAQIYGLEPDQAKDGLPLDAFLGNILPEDHDRVRDTIAASMQHGRQIQVTYRVRRPDSSVVTAMGIGQCFYSQARQPVHYAGIVVPLSSDEEPANAVIMQVLAAYKALRDIRADEAAEKVLEAMELVVVDTLPRLVKH